MKKVSERTMRSVNGGYWYCKVCGYKNYFKAIVMAHTITSGHAFTKK